MSEPPDYSLHFSPEDTLEGVVQRAHEMGFRARSEAQFMCARDDIHGSKKATVKQMGLLPALRTNSAGTLRYCPRCWSAFWPSGMVMDTPAL